jgi:hypothetical protein
MGVACCRVGEPLQCGEGIFRRQIQDRRVRVEDLPIEGRHLIEQHLGGREPLRQTGALFQGLTQGYGGVGLTHMANISSPPLSSCCPAASRKPKLGLIAQDEKAALLLQLKAAWLATASASVIPHRRFIRGEQMDRVPRR